jgi:hypothetical protein
LVAAMHAGSDKLVEVAAIFAKAAAKLEAGG